MTLRLLLRVPLRRGGGSRKKNVNNILDIYVLFNTTFLYVQPEIVVCIMFLNLIVDTIHFSITITVGSNIFQ